MEKAEKIILTLYVLTFLMYLFSCILYTKLYRDINKLIRIIREAADEAKPRGDQGVSQAIRETTPNRIGLGGKV